MLQCRSFDAAQKDGKEAVVQELQEETPAPDILRLRCTAGPCNGKVYLKPGRSLTVGRTAASKICVQDPSVSEKHAKFEWTGTHWQLQDVGSSNGTRVNGNELDPYGEPLELKDGDVILFGEESVLHTEIKAATSEDLSVEEFLQAECLRIEHRLQAKLEQSSSMLREEWKVERQKLLAEAAALGHS